MGPVGGNLLHHRNIFALPLSAPRVFNRASGWDSSFPPFMNMLLWGRSWVEIAFFHEGDLEEDDCGDLGDHPPPSPFLHNVCCIGKGRETRRRQKA
jgi:hypothetical protein